MNRAIQSAVSVWAQGVLSATDAELFEDEHLDQVLGDVYDPEQAVTHGLMAYQALLHEVYPRAYDILSGLSIPLEATAYLEVTPPDVSRLEDSIRRVEPPRIYLQSRKAVVTPRQWEEYRRPLDQDLVRPESGLIVCYYIAYRSLVDIRQNWEYARQIRFEHYPPRLPALG